jgi:adenylate kinase
MKIILLGAPGAGKGTVSKLLTALDGSVQISTGDILRGAVKAGTALGKEAQGFMDRGDLVPDSLIMGIMEQRLQEPDCKKGFLLDGFPRTISQADSLDALMKRINVKLDLVASIEVPRDVILDRLTTRRTCSNASCQEIYNIKSNPPAPGDKCKKCGSPTIQRADETVEAISKRLDVYNEKTAPLIGYYEKTGMLLKISEPGSDGVVKAIQKGIAARK